MGAAYLIKGEPLLSVKQANSKGVGFVGVMGRASD